MTNYSLILSQYIQQFGQDNSFSKLQQQLENQEDVINRKNMNGHFTCSPLVFNKDMSKLLCIYHKAFQVRQQPGGHIDDYDDHPFVHGLRELSEETGLDYVNLHPWHLNNNLCPIYLDPQEVGERIEKQEGKHRHYDIQFVCIGDDSQNIHDGDEGIVESKWIEIENLSDVMKERVRIVQQRID